MPGSLAVAIIGVFAGQMYRSDLANLKAYRIPPSVVRFSQNYLLPLVGSTRPPRRLTRALPDETRPSAVADAARGENEEVITTAIPTSGSTPEGGNNEGSGTGTGSGTSVVREWVNELTGRGTDPGIRAPPEAEISQVMLMFPDLQREVVVGALQRRRVLLQHLQLLTLIFSFCSPNIERAVETLLSST
jgi:hypothetical protein